MSAIVIGLNIETKTVGGIASIKGGFPSFHIPDLPFSFATLKIIFRVLLLLHVLGLLRVC